MMQFALLIAKALERASVVARNEPSMLAPGSLINPVAKRFTDAVSTALLRHYSVALEAAVTEVSFSAGANEMGWEATVHRFSEDAEDVARQRPLCEARAHLVIKHATEVDLRPVLDSFNKLVCAAAPDKLFIGTPTVDHADYLESMASLARDRADGIHLVALPLVAAWSAPRRPLARVWVLERGQWVGGS